MNVGIIEKVAMREYETFKTKNTKTEKCYHPMLSKIRLKSG